MVERVDLHRPAADKAAKQGATLLTVVQLLIMQPNCSTEGGPSSLWM